MTTNELANKLRCHVARHGDCEVLIDVTRTEDQFLQPAEIVWLDDPTLKRKVLVIRGLSE